LRRETLGHAAIRERGIFRSTDGGNTWTKLYG
jgi:hypothetical protein